MPISTKTQKAPLNSRISDSEWKKHESFIKKCHAEGMKYPDMLERLQERGLPVTSRQLQNYTTNKLKLKRNVDRLGQRYPPAPTINPKESGPNSALKRERELASICQSHKMPVSEAATCPFCECLQNGSSTAFNKALLILFGEADEAIWRSLDKIGLSQAAATSACFWWSEQVSASDNPSGDDESSGRSKRNLPLSTTVLAVIRLMTLQTQNYATLKSIDNFLCQDEPSWKSPTTKCVPVLQDFRAVWANHYTKIHHIHLSKKWCQTTTETLLATNPPDCSSCELFIRRPWRDNMEDIVWTLNPRIPSKLRVSDVRLEAELHELLQILVKFTGHPTNVSFRQHKLDRWTVMTPFEALSSAINIYYLHQFQGEEDCWHYALENTTKQGRLKTFKDNILKLLECLRQVSHDQRLQDIGEINFGHLILNIKLGVPHLSTKNLLNRAASSVNGIGILEGYFLRQNRYLTFPVREEQEALPVHASRGLFPISEELSHVSPPGGTPLTSEPSAALAPSVATDLQSESQAISHCIGGPEPRTVPSLQDEAHLSPKGSCHEPSNIGQGALDSCEDTAGSHISISGNVQRNFLNHAKSRASEAEPEVVKSEEASRGMMLENDNNETHNLPLPLSGGEQLLAYHVSGPNLELPGQLYPEKSAEGLVDQNSVLDKVSVQDQESMQDATKIVSDPTLAPCATPSQLHGLGSFRALKRQHQNKDFSIYSNPPFEETMSSLTSTLRLFGISVTGPSRRRRKRRRRNNDQVLYWW